MAGDWIQMRVWLARDPKLLWMADFLSTDRGFMDWLTNPVQGTCHESAYEHVTRDVVASLCVTGLLQVWGMAREQGQRIEDDLVVKFCDAETVSAIAGIPNFGQAMLNAHWLEELPDNAARFPNFFKQKRSPGDRFGQSGAERQRAYRERLKEKQVTREVTTRDVTRDGKVTLEKRREEKKNKESKSHSVPSDPRSAHPAIQAVREASKLYPPKAVWDEIIAKVGESPDQPRLTGSFVEWSKHGFKPTNLAWIFDWYLNGIPEFGNGANHQQKPSYSQRQSAAIRAALGPIGLREAGDADAVGVQRRLQAPGSGRGRTGFDSG